MSSAGSSAKSEKPASSTIEEKAVKLSKRNSAKDIDSIFDASFIKGWSARDPLDNQTGYSDRDARVGRAGRTFGLGYKLHLAIDSATMLPLACTFASANQNEQKHSLNLLEKTKLILKQSEAQALRHKDIKSTMKYIHAIPNFKEIEYEIATATTQEEIMALGKAGFEKYDESNGIHYYRRIPRKTLGANPK